MASDLQKIVQWLYRRDVDDVEVQFDNLVSEFAEKKLTKNPMEAAAYAAANSKRFFSGLLRASDDDVVCGRTPLVARLTDPSARKFSFVLPYAELTVSQTLARKRYESRAEILRYLDLLDDREYEAVCIVAAKWCGASHTLLTPKGNEGGIDFFARLKQPSLTHVFSHSTAPIRIVGQSKKYSERVSVDKVRDFAQVMASVRHQDPFVEPYVPYWFRNTGGAIMGWLVSQTGFQSGAEQMARNHGIILSTSVDMAELFAMSRKAPLEKTAKLRAEAFCESAAREVTDLLAKP